MAAEVIKEKKAVPYTGNMAAAEAMRQINPDVVAAYPITPQTELMEFFAKFVADGLVDTEFITVESEHSALSAVVGASAAGARAMTATAGPGLALMWEILGVASGMRTPIVISLVNRALSSPISIHPDHSDMMGARDMSWIQILAENAEEAYDNLIQAFKIAENRDVLLPVMTSYDGFIISHSIERVELLPDAAVREFVGEFEPFYPLLDVEHPSTHGPLALTDSYMEFKRQQREAMMKAYKVVKEVGEEFKNLKPDKNYSTVDPFMTEDAEFILIVMGSAAGTAKHVAKELRKKGIKAGVLRVRLFRPFPYYDVADVLRASNVRAIGVMDRAETFGGYAGPLFSEVVTALYTEGMQIPVAAFIYGLGGRDCNIEHINQAFDVVQKAAAGEKVPYLTYLNLQE